MYALEYGGNDLSFENALFGGADFDVLGAHDDVDGFVYVEFVQTVEGFSAEFYFFSAKSFNVCK